MESVPDLLHSNKFIVVCTFIQFGMTKQGLVQLNCYRGKLFQLLQLQTKLQPKFISKETGKT